LILSDGADTKQRTDMRIGATLSCHSMMELTSFIFTIHAFINGKFELVLSNMQFEQKYVTSQILH
jgi:hypothetical protein